MPKIFITVSGPGGCLYAHINEIKKLFEQYGANVVIKPDRYFPVDHYSSSANGPLDWDVEILPKNLPWGG